MRAVLAVTLGVVLWGGLWTASHALLANFAPAAFDAQGFTDDARLLLAFLVIATGLSTLAGYLAAWVASQRPMRVVLILALIQLLIGIAVQSSAWERMPLWYHVPFLMMVLPAHLLGGWIRSGRRVRRMASRLA